MYIFDGVFFPLNRRLRDFCPQRNHGKNNIFLLFLLWIKTILRQIFCALTVSALVSYSDILLAHAVRNAWQAEYVSTGQGKNLWRSRKNSLNTDHYAHITAVYYRSMVACNDTCTVHTPKSETYLVHVTRHTVNGNLWFWVGGIFYSDV